MAIIKDFEKFLPSIYLSEYYTTIDEENRFLLQFLHEVYDTADCGKRLLEVGGGPTIYQLISAGNRVEEIIFSEYLDANRNEIKKWVHDDPVVPIWDIYFEHVLGLEKTSTSKTDIERRKTSLRQKIKDIVRCDLFNKNPLQPETYRDFDVISVNFCPESITDNEEDFLTSVQNFTSLLKRNGLLVMCLLKNASRYKVGDLHFPAYPVDEAYISDTLKRFSYNEITIRSVPAECDSGYEGLIALTATKTQ